MVQKGAVVGIALVVALMASMVTASEPAIPVESPSEALVEDLACGHEETSLSAGFVEASGIDTPNAMDVICTHKIRPGVKVGGCTLAWILHDPIEDVYYASTAGHCLGYNSRPTVARLAGQFGEVVYTTGSGGIGRDFALIRIFDDYVQHINPEMCVWGGPTGVHDGSSILGQSVVHVGHGTAVRTNPLVPPYAQTGIGGSTGVNHFFWVGTALWGDSGSPIRLESGEALGVVTHLGVGTGNNVGMFLDRGIQMAYDEGKIPNPDLQLLTVEKWSDLQGLTES
jgi:hypothetical protein